MNKKNALMDYGYIFGTIACTIYGQIVLKWRIDMKTGFPDGGKIYDIFLYYLNLFLDPFILSGFLSGFLASLFWMVAISKFEISFAYPFMSLAPAIVFFLGIWLFGETLTLGKVLGLVVIIIGLIITVKF